MIMSGTSDRSSGKKMSGALSCGPVQIEISEPY